MRPVRCQTKTGIDKIEKGWHRASGTCNADGKIVVVAMNVFGMPGQLRRTVMQMGGINGDQHQLTP